MTARHATQQKYRCWSQRASSRVQLLGGKDTMEIQLFLALRLALAAAKLSRHEGLPAEGYPHLTLCHAEDPACIM